MSNTPQSKADAIASLNQTIDKLEDILSQLDATPGETVPSESAFTKLTDSIDELAASLEQPEPTTATPPTPTPESASPPEPPTAEPVEPKATTPSTAEAPETPPAPPETSEPKEAEVPLVSTEEIASQAKSEPTQPTITDRVLPSFRTLQRFWDGLLEKVRNLLPNAFSEKLNDWGLTAIIAAVIVALLWTGVGLLLLPEPASEVAQVPETPTSEVEPQVDVETKTNESPTLDIETPEAVTAPAEPKVVKNVPPPKPKLTPEQGLIAAIQNQVSEITNEYAEGLIESIEADFMGSRLLISVSPQWYTLPPSRQDKIANEMYARSRRLDFSKLELNDPDGTLLARSPVVGNQMVILQR
jgi:outer membrane biosynthesis protein TonB